MTEGDIIGHEPMGIVEEVGSGITNVQAGDRVVMPFQMSCGHCFMCNEELYTQCETTQVREEGKGAALFGYTKLYGSVPGGQAEFLRVPQAQNTTIKVPEGPSDDRFLFLSDVLPTAWQAVKYSDVPEGGTLLVLGAGPIGDMSARMGVHQGYRVIVVDRVPERLARVEAYGAGAVDLTEAEKLGGVGAFVRELTDGRGPDAVIDAVGMEAHGATAGAAAGKLAHQMVGFLPDKVGEKVMNEAGVDRLTALYASIDIVRRGGTISLSGVYGGEADPLPMLTMFDKQIQLRMGQANVKKWVPEIMPLLTDEDPLGVDDFATHRLPLDAAPEAYEKFQKKQDGTIKVLLQPGL
jgi:threonine dehydrogenase-like Zn-dependent dehydrogenase